MSALKTLSEKLATALDDTAKAWFDSARQQLDDLEGDIDTLANRLIFTIGTTSRKLGVTAISGSVSSGYTADKYGECDRVYLNHWTTIDAARVVFIADIINKKRFNPDEFFQLCYRYSDDAERSSLLKGLALMNLTAQSTDFIIDTARTNSLSLFSALAYENPWPAVYFPAAAFNQMVLKSLFMGLDISHVTGLHAKMNIELGRMTADYVQERLDAGRPVPASIWLVVDASRLEGDAMNAWQAALRSDDEKSRQLAATASEWQPELPPPC